MLATRELFVPAPINPNDNIAPIATSSSLSWDNLDNVSMTAIFGLLTLIKPNANGTPLRTTGSQYLSFVNTYSMCIPILCHVIK